MSVVDGPYVLMSSGNSGDIAIHAIQMQSGENTESR